MSGDASAEPMSASSAHSQPAVAGHRGCGHLAPENTLLAFEKAVELGLDYIEFDVWKTTDDDLVVIHDWNSYRTTGEKNDVENTNRALLTDFYADAAYSAPDAEDAVPAARDARCIISFPFLDVEIGCERIRQLSKITRTGPLSILPDSWGERLLDFFEHDPPGRVSNETIRPTVPSLDETLRFFATTDRTIRIDLKGELKTDPLSVHERVMENNMASQVVYISWESSCVRNWSQTFIDIVTKPLQWVSIVAARGHYDCDWVGLEKIKREHPETEARTAVHYKSSRVPTRSISFQNAVSTAEAIDADIFLADYAQMGERYPKGIEEFWKDMETHGLQPAVSAVGATHRNRIESLFKLEAEYISSDRPDIVRRTIEDIADE